MKRIIVMLALLLLVSPAMAEEEVNTGQDFTKPLTRVDLRYKYQDLANEKTSENIILRVDKPFVLDGGWLLSTRFDVPFVRTNVVSLDNPNGDDEVGMSDFLGQFLMIAPQGDKNWTWAYGVQAIVPVASQDQMGTGRYQVAPMLGAKMDLPSISKGSFGGLLLSEHIDVGGFSGRAKQNYTAIQPMFNMNLPHFWFVNVAPEIRVNWEKNGQWNIPFAIMVGKMLNKSTVVSLEYKTPIIDGYDIYNHEIEARIGFFF